MVCRAALVAAAAILLPRTPVRAATPTADEITRHVETLLQDTGPALYKWASPIRYRSNGLDAISRLVLSQAFQAVGKAIDLPITEVSKPQVPTEAYLVFTDDPAGAANAPGVQRFFRDPSESEEQFVGRFTRQLQHGSVGTLSLGEHGIASMIEIFYSPVTLPDDASDNGRDVRLAQIAFKLVTRAQPSDVLPSVMNPGGATTALTPVDVAFLQALQAPSVGFRMPTDEAIREIARLMTAALR
jgi:hypothetical protein